MMVSALSSNRGPMVRNLSNTWLRVVVQLAKSNVSDEKVMKYCCRIILFWIIIWGVTACQTGTVTSPHWRWTRVEAGLQRQAIFTAVAADPLNSENLWAGYYSAGGLVTSHNGGQTWLTNLEGVGDNPVFNLLPVVYAPDGEPKVEVWAATRDGLLVSINYGNSWQPVTASLPPVSVSALAADAGGRVYVGLDEGGIYAQTADGMGWEPLTANDSPLAAAGVITLAVSPDGKFVYAGTSGGGVFASTDGGLSWTNAYPQKFIPNIAANPQNPQEAVASLRIETIADEEVARQVENLSTQNFLARTLNGGQSWHKLSPDWANDQVTALLWLSDGILVVATGRGQLFSTVDGGDTWSGGVFLPGGGVLDLAVAGESRLLAASWAGLFASDDSGQTWANLAPGLGTPNAQALLATSNNLLLGTQTGLYRWQPETLNWQQLANHISVTSLAAAPDRHLFYLGTSGDGVYRSEDAGTTWSKLPGLGMGVPDLAVNPQNSDHMMLLAAWERPYETLDGGNIWNARWTGLSNETETVSLAMNPLEPITYVGTEAGLYLSRQGDIWRPVAFNLLDESVLTLLSQIVPRGLWKGTVLYIGTTRGVYRSFDNGATVQGVDNDPGWGYGLQDVSVTALLADPHKPQLLYAGTAYHGVYQSVDGGQMWQPIGPAEMSEEIIESMAWGPDGELFFVTPGGVWQGEKEVVK
jgi:photosystem II stability/assembly factor-like uncharacterized protein